MKPPKKITKLGVCLIRAKRGLPIEVHDVKGTGTSVVRLVADVEH